MHYFRFTFSTLLLCFAALIPLNRVQASWRTPIAHSPDTKFVHEHSRGMGFKEPLKSIQARQEKLKDFYVLTIPKSGSFLILKLLSMLTNRTTAAPMQDFPQLGGYTFPGDHPNASISEEELDEKFHLWKKFNRFALAHCNLAEPFTHFSQTHPEYVKILHVRDLRDTLISCLFFQKPLIENAIGSSSIGEMLLYLIREMKKSSFPHCIMNIYRQAEQAAILMDDPEFVVTRFENLVGEKGGGTIEKQRQDVQVIAEALNVELTAEKEEWILSDLFGVQNGPSIKMTFREGRIGRWKDYFKEEHRVEFEKEWGDLQLALGYDLDWE